MVFSHPKGGTFTTPDSYQDDLKNEYLINHKTVFGIQNPAFWLGAVSCCAFCRFITVKLMVGNKFVYGDSSV